jgi:hypothetical protein
MRAAKEVGQTGWGGRRPPRPGPIPTSIARGSGGVERAVPANRQSQSGVASDPAWTEAPRSRVRQVSDPNRTAGDLDDKPRWGSRPLTASRVRARAREEPPLLTPAEWVVGHRQHAVR